MDNMGVVDAMGDLTGKMVKAFTAEFESRLEYLFEDMDLYDLASDMEGLMSDAIKERLLPIVRDEIASMSDSRLREMARNHVEESLTKSMRR